MQDADAALARPLAAEAIWQAGQAIFGEGFWILPAIDAPVGTDSWSAALAAPTPGASPTAVRTLPNGCRLGAGGRAAFPRSDPARGGDRRRTRAASSADHRRRGRAASGWIGAKLPLDEPTPTVPVVSTVLDVAGAYDAASATVALVVDEWVDAVPVRARRGKGADAPIDQRLTSGVTFNAKAPSARAPQAMLLAISPDGARWTGDALIETFEERLGPGPAAHGHAGKNERDREHFARALRGELVFAGGKSASPSEGLGDDACLAAAYVREN